MATRKGEHTFHSGSFQGLRRQLSSVGHFTLTPPAALAAAEHDCTLRWVRVTVPASSANIGPGFDCLGVAIDLPFHLDVGEPQELATELDQHHPATTSFREAGGSGPLFAETHIPPGKGLGFSGAARVAGLAAASLQRSGAIRYPELLTKAGSLEGHFDNVAASIYGSITATNNHTVVRLHCPPGLSIVTWIPEHKTSTNLSRNRLPSSVSFGDAVKAVGRSSVLVAAIANGDLDAMRIACQDDLHQPTRLNDAPDSAQAITLALEHGACAAWLSGSGPTVAAFVPSELAETVSLAFPNSGHRKILEVAPYGISIS